MKKLRLMISNRFWKRRLRGFDKNKAKPIKEINAKYLVDLEVYYDVYIRKDNTYVIEFKEVRDEERLRVMNSRRFAEWMVVKRKFGL